jgi:hypothetical protein
MRISGCCGVSLFDCREVLKAMGFINEMDNLTLTMVFMVISTMHSK